MRGRDAEWAQLVHMLQQVRAGRSQVLLLRGEPGIGKSLLLAETAAAARGQGFSVITVVAHELERVIPLCPLLVALGDSAGLSAEHASTQVRAIARVREHIDGLAATGPVLVTVDDAHFADPATLLALYLLPRQLSGRPVGWLLARSTERGTGTESLFSLLAGEGADEIALGALPGEAVDGLVADLVKGRLDEGSLAMLGSLGGNPALIREFIEGLREERLLRTSAGKVTMVANRIPRRLHSIVRSQVSDLGPAVWPLIEAAAVLGRSFAVTDLAEMLGQPPVALLPALDDAMSAGILIADGDVLSFRDGIVWRAVTDAIPDPVARALNLQFAETRLERGSALAAAGYLLNGVWRSDQRELGLLTRAAEELMQAAPETSADLALRALELTGTADPARLGRSLIAIRALVAARHLDRALEITRESLSRSAVPGEQAELRCGQAAIYNLTGKPDLARTEALWVLDRADVPEDTRAEASVLLLRALAALPDQREAEQRARAVLAERRNGDARAAATAIGVLATLRWRQGRIADGLRLFRAATSGVRLAGRGTVSSSDARLDLASRLIDIRKLDEARTLVNAPAADAELVNIVDVQARPALLRARIHLCEGQLDDADDAARAALSRDPGTGDCLGDAPAICLLAWIALRRGDPLEAEGWLDKLPADVLAASPGRLAVPYGLTRALATQLRDGAEAAYQPIEWLYDSISEYKWVLIADPDVAPWLVRLAIAAGDGKRARLVVAEADGLGRANQAFSAVAASGKHAAGLFYQDAELLAAAAGTQPDRWGRAAAAEDLGVLLAARDSKDDAIAFLGQAHDGYAQLGAMRDEARVWHRLRALGEVRRRWAAGVRERPLEGWESLTECEANVAELVAQGLTNRQIAEQSFISVHTVAFHLRQIFRKLNLTSRVELVRLVLAAHQEAG